MGSRRISEKRRHHAGEVGDRARLDRPAIERRFESTQGGAVLQRRPGQARRRERADRLPRSGPWHAHPRPSRPERRSPGGLHDQHGCPRANDRRHRCAWCGLRPVRTQRAIGCRSALHLDRLHSEEAPASRREGDQVRARSGRRPLARPLPRRRGHPASTDRRERHPAVR